MIDWSQFGLLGAVLGVVFTGLGIVVKLLYTRLLGEEHGLLTNYIERNKHDLDNAIIAHEAILRRLGELEVVVERLHTIHMDPDSLFSTVVLRAAAWHAVSAAQDACPTESAEVREHLSKAKEALAGIGEAKINE